MRRPRKLLTISILCVIMDGDIEYRMSDICKNYIIKQESCQDLSWNLRCVLEYGYPDSQSRLEFTRRIAIGLCMSRRIFEALQNGGLGCNGHDR